MRFEVLGPLAVWTDQGEPVAVPGRKVRALLADLLVHEGRVVSVDRLVDDLWGPTPPADPTAAVHVRVSQLRRALAAAEPEARDLVVSRQPGYALRAGPDAVDAARFAALTGQAQAARDQRARAGLLTDALALWRGAALADFADQEFAQVAAARWEEQRLAALESQAETRLALGEHRELVGELGAQVAEHPYRERLRAAHMRALYRAGRVAEALDGFQELRNLLADELGLDPSAELAALHQAILAGDPAENAPPPSRPAARPATNLPAPVTELIGRDHAVRRVRELLETGRLVTLTGAGGVGKTSVALTAARALSATYPDGAWLVDLSTWDGRGDPAEVVLHALRIPDAPGEAGPAGRRLAAALSERRTLLVLDSCEHVIEPVAALVSGLLREASGLRVLATSREPLRLRGEARWEVPPLEVPDTDHPERLVGAPAVRLFLERAGLDRVDAETTSAVAEVCRRLDGIPLALELAATRVPAFGVGELAARLRVPQDRFGLLGGGARDAPARQRTLAAVIDWSWRLLSGPEQAVLRRLAVHSGGCDLGAAEAVCAGGGVPSGEVLDLLASLVDRSLVARAHSDGGGPRFRLLESVLAYCLERLRDSGEEEATRLRHADHYLALAERADPELRGSGQREWLRRLDAESANLQAALDTFHREGAAGRALRLAGTLTWYWYLRSRHTEARRALATAMNIPGEAPAALRTRAEVWHAGLAVQRGHGPAHVTEVLRAHEAVAGPPDAARAGWFLSASFIATGDLDTAAPLLASALETARSAGDRWGEAAVLSSRAMLAHVRDDLGAMEDDARRSAELFDELGDEWGALQAAAWLIGLADITGDHREAARLTRDGLRVAEELGLWSEVAGRKAWLAWTSVQTGDYRTARDHAGEARRLAAEQGHEAGEVFATISLAFAARRCGDLDQAEEHLRWLLASARTTDGDPPYLSMVLVESGLLAVRRGDPSTALAHHREGFEAFRDQDSVRGMAWALDCMAAALVLDERPGLAARLLGAADAARRRTGRPLSPSDRDELARTTTAVRAAEPDFPALFARGGELTPEEAHALLNKP